MKTPDHWEHLGRTLASDVNYRVADRSPSMRKLTDIHHAAANSCFEMVLFSDHENAAPLRQNLDRITLEDLRKIFATFYVAFSIFHKQSFADEAWLTTMRWVEKIYAQPATFCDDWIMFEAEKRSHPNFAALVLFKMNDTINPILGIDPNEPMTTLLWGGLIKGMRAYMQEIVAQEGKP